MSETQLEEISPEEARKALQSVIDHCEGRVNIGQEELKGLGALFVLKWRTLAPILVEMCGSEDAALVQVRQMKAQFKIRDASTDTN